MKIFIYGMFLIFLCANLSAQRKIEQKIFDQFVDYVDGKFTQNQSHIPFIFDSVDWSGKPITDKLRNIMLDAVAKGNSRSTNQISRKESDKESNLSSFPWMIVFITLIFLVFALLGWWMFSLVKCMGELRDDLEKLEQKIVNLENKKPEDDSGYVTLEKEETAWKELIRENILFVREELDRLKKIVVEKTTSMPEIDTTVQFSMNADPKKVNEEKVFKKIYAEEPNDQNQFQRITDSFIPGASIYEITLSEDEQKGLFSICNDPDTMERAIKNKKTLLNDACDFKGGSINATQIVIERKGRTELSPTNQWIIIEKAVISFK